MKIKISFQTFLFLTLFTIQNQARAGGTVVGNGGDPVFEFLETARTSMIETLKVVVNDPSELANFCILQSLNTEQIKFCRDFFITVAPDILRLSQNLGKTLFVLREESLFVKGPDGKPMIVAARTDLGPLGPIEFNRDAVKTMLPTQVLFLITHEFQHKSSFFGTNVNDNDAIGPFATGRDLIDSVAKAVVAVARKKGKVGSQFGIRDIFDCVVNVGTSQFGARISSIRQFQTEDLMTYQTSFGKNPTDGSIYLPETSNTALILRFEIIEPNNCGEPNQLRKTSTQIVRRTKLVDGSTQDAVLSEFISTSNPMCSKTDPRLEIAWNELKFSCQFYGSEGTTSSLVSEARIKAK